MEHDTFLQFMMQNIDIGFVSLTSEYLGACVPSKIYEYINLGLPMLGALPSGDAMDIINQNNYGLACQYNDIRMLINNLKKLKEKALILKYKENILRERSKWAMGERIKEVVKSLNDL